MDPVTLFKKRQEIIAKHKAKITDAKRSAVTRRAFVFVPHDIVIHGFLLAPLTIRKVAMLEAIKSPFLYSLRDEKSREVLLDPVDTCRVLWILSPRYTPSCVIVDWQTWLKHHTAGMLERTLIRRYVKACKKDVLFHDKMREVLYEYIDMCFIDARGGNAGAREATKSNTASLIYQLAFNMHWSRECILDLVYNEAMQYCVAIEEEECAKAGAPTVSFNSESDHIWQDMLQELNGLPRIPGHRNVTII